MIAKYRAKHIHVLPGNELLPTPWVYGDTLDGNYLIDNVTGFEVLIDSATVARCVGVYAKVAVDDKLHILYEGDIVTVNVLGEVITGAIALLEDTPVLESSALPHGILPLSLLIDDTNMIKIEAVSMPDGGDPLNIPDDEVDAESGKYPAYIVRVVLNQKELDDTKDNRSAIQQMTPNEVFESVCLWEGFINYADTIKSWIQDIYGVNLDE